ncbi:unnamed protein product [Rhizophagus irregularis]|nr:unnamed protein product [Rhizophagus irregularis]
MSSETSTPYTPASTSISVAGNETVSLADEIKKYDTAKLIEFLQGQGLGLSETAIKILEEEEINASVAFDDEFDYLYGIVTTASDWRDARVEELEQKNTELEARLAIVEQGSLVVDDQLHKEAISKRFVEQTVSDVDLSSSVTDQRNNDDAKTSEEKEMDAKDSSSVTSDMTHCEEDPSMTSAELVTLPEQVVKESIPACKSVTSSNKSSAGTSPVKSPMADKQVLASENTETECQKIPYNQKVEQDLRRELSSTEVGDGKINKAFDIQIPELSLEAILIGSSEVTAQNIVDLFRVAMKLRRKEILCWYCYYKAYEDRVRDVKSKNGVDDKSARTLVYSEIKPLLPDITDIQDIIDDFPKKATNTDDEDSVPNWNRHVTLKTNKTEIQADPLGVSTSANVLSTSQSKPTYDRSYFRNKTLDQYPNLCREFSSENFDYYGITGETSCPLCSLDHDDEESIEGRYKSGSYFIKCEQREIELTA